MRNFLALTSQIIRSCRMHACLHTYTYIHVRHLCFPHVAIRSTYFVLIIPPVASLHSRHSRHSLRWSVQFDLTIAAIVIVGKKHLHYIHIYFIYLF